MNEQGNTINATATAQDSQRHAARETAAIVPTPPDEEHAVDVHMPSPSIWPIVSAFGVTMISFGFLAGIAYGIFGVIVLIVSLWGWIGVMRHE